MRGTEIALQRFVTTCEATKGGARTVALVMCGALSELKAEELYYLDLVRHFEPEVKQFVIVVTK
jgi:hypothetical protein